MPPVALSHPETSDSPAPDFAPQQAEQGVGSSLPVGVGQGTSAADAEREVAIQHAGREVIEHMNKYAETGDFGERGAADAARLRMEALIRGRSQAQVERMEEERGLR